MNMRESALWKSLRKCLPPEAMAERIENSVGTAMPDVLISYWGKVFVVELKSGSEVSRAQADWARRWALAGGISWFLIASEGHKLYLVPGASGVQLLRSPDFLLTWRVDGMRDAVERML